ncbi:uncharacterized protein LOC100210596 [Hydra vulgaris]|uniref:uncharacterized protein LOC100210596 n=1 Tax=Hydra vulgaris TaxID=6087 RepID=UPI00019273E1|nr:uncharacterized protein LOC100210596 [Hydra vulgaris]
MIKHSFYKLFDCKTCFKFRLTRVNFKFYYLMINYIYFMGASVENLNKISSSSQPRRCTYENVLANHTFIRNKQAGIFTHLGHTTNIHECKALCCKQTDCDVAFMPENHCYAVSCFSDQHCATTPANAENFNVQLVKVRRVVIPDPGATAPGEEDIIRSSLPGLQKDEDINKKEEVEVQSLNLYEELLCTHSPILYNVTLKGGSKGGQFTDLGLVENMEICIELCCEIKECDLSFMIDSTCIAVHCSNEELCQTVKAKPSTKSPKIAYIRRKEKAHKHRASLHPQLVQPIVKFHEKPAPVLRPSTCQARKIYNNATLIGGMRAGNYTSLGKATHLQDCIGRACDLNEGHLAIMLGQYCYSVTCKNQRICQTVPAIPSHLKPKVAYLAWTQEPIEQDTITNMAESDFFVNHKRYPKCKRSHIMYNHTLKGGLRAGNFSMLASVDDIEVCAALCCEEKDCDLALMIGDNCYAGDCASPELCSAVPVPAGAAQRSQIAYITAPGRKKSEDRWENSDWSMVYLIVSGLVIGISLLGTAWTVCLCALRRNQRKLLKRKKENLSKLVRVERSTSMKDLPLNEDLMLKDEPIGTSSRNSFN